MTRRGVALIRGEDLNPFELQAYQHVSTLRPFVAVGRANPAYEVSAIGVPVVLGDSLGARRVSRGLARRACGRFPALDPARLRNLGALVGEATILHSAELVLPVSEQAAALAGGRHRLVLTCWETIPFRYDTDEVLTARKNAVMARTDRFVAVTELASVALQAEGVEPDLVRVIPAGIDTDRFHPDRDGAAVRAGWGIRPGQQVVLYVGRLIQEKGVLQLVRAIAQLPGATLVLLGRGPEIHRVHTVAARLGVSDRVVLPGFVSYADLPAAYAAADALAVPSLTTPYWEEQFGMVLAEAMASGRAIVTTRSGAIPEVVGDAAVLVDPYDVVQLTTALGDVLSDTSLRTELEVRARRRAESLYALDVVGPQLEAMYAELD